jgi:hypothetical protein
VEDHPFLGVDPPPRGHACQGETEG